ncbi:hypothetical protein J2X36_004560 [Methylobacterium sp. BE186]|uniref:hypothetical protein n=1 Tax=Methylobacterium sp. BE186 TaxID=2817715 RepID=UPI00285D5BAE|nr:hypothetical protein [Methylobacterium sp. BE186]MDR7039782.1 hypothetical protein [Methylobacterium sp. BE186]
MPVPAEATFCGSSSEPITDLFIAFEALLTKHEAALWRCDRREAWLQSELDYPRVPLPTAAGAPTRYAADIETIARHVPPGRRRYRLQQVLHRRQQAWARGARACGLTRTQEQEAALAEAVRAAATTLLATPAKTLTGIRLKLLVLLATQDPGEAFRDASPWRELHLILADVSALVAEI